jgi:uncharacterized protein YdeI (YjbR/CyaY-like superfamily)
MARGSGNRALKTLHVTTRAQWRRWLERHHETEREVWLVSYRTHTGRSRISYNDAVEEALCFGWIDSNQKGIDEDRVAQRYTPRRRAGGFSEMNKQRVRRLVAEGRMTPAGLAKIGDALQVEPFTLAKDVEQALRKDRATWRNFQAFPESYRRVRVAYVEAGRRRPGEFEKRLRHLVDMTAKNKRFGFVKEFR